MPPLYGDENMELPVVTELRRLGCDVLTALEAGRANRGIPDADQLAYAMSLGRAVLTFDRRDFRRLHALTPAHAGIITCTRDHDRIALAQRIFKRVSAQATLAGQLVRVTKAG